MKVVSVRQMRAIDERAQTEFGLSGFDLMDAAGTAMAESILERFEAQAPCIICGKGNNAGDGFVVARRLHERGLNPVVVCLESPDSYAGAAGTAWERLAATKVSVKGFAELEPVLESCDLIIDALLGTGISGPPPEKYAGAIAAINASRRPVVALDIPSGVRELDESESPGAAVKADVTLTVGALKTVLLIGSGRRCAGEIEVLPINFPPPLLDSPEIELNWAPESEMGQWLPPRIPDSNKGTWGHVGIVGATPEFAGATLMTARGALRTGCGLATIYTLASTNAIYKTALPEATSHIVGESDDTTMAAPAAEQFLEKADKHKIVTVGPGLGTSPGATGFVERVLSEWKRPLVLDADALNILSDGRQDLLRERSDCLLTPHPGEMARLTGLSVPEVQARREAVVREFARKYEVMVLLKGEGTLVARPDGQVWLVPGAEPALAKGGTGDVLTGVIAALFAQGMPLWQAAVVGAWAHLHAGTSCARIRGSRGVLASEVADEVPLILDRLPAPTP